VSVALPQKRALGLAARRPWALIGRGILIAIVLAVIVWLAIKASEGGTKFLVVTFDGLTIGGLYFVIAAGFTLIFGLMRVVNMAHGSLYLFAGYLAYKAQAGWFHGAASQFSLSAASSVSVVAMVVPLIYATVVIGLVGLAIQQVLLRWNQGQELRQALITIAVSVVLADQLLAHYGGIAESISQPTAWPLSITVGAFRYPFFRMAVVLGSAVAIGVLLYLLIKRTRFGMIVRAGVDDRAMLSAMGVNVQLVFAGAFLIGSMLAGFAGVLGGVVLSVQPGFDTQFLLDALIVVIIGGMGSLGGAAIGAVLLGLVQNYSADYLMFGSTDLTNYAILLTFILVIVVLAVRPLGLFGRPA
jgi:branched-chain amino acid transport system permease protein